MTEVVYKMFFLLHGKSREILPEVMNETNWVKSHCRFLKTIRF